MLTVEKLKAFGCNTDEGLQRCMSVRIPLPISPLLNQPVL